MRPTCPHLDMPAVDRPIICKTGTSYRSFVSWIISLTYGKWEFRCCSLKGMFSANSLFDKKPRIPVLQPLLAFFSTWLSQWSNLTLRRSNFITRVWCKGPKGVTISEREYGPDFLHYSLNSISHILDRVHIRPSWWPVKEFDIGLQRQPFLNHTKNRTFLHIFQNVRPNVRSLCSIRPACINEFDMPAVRHIRTETL
jgi:hypothetical protein